jgi:hypothetical protein
LRLLCSLLAPGTTHTYRGLFTEEVSFAACSVTEDSVRAERREGQFSELFRHHSPSLVNALRMRIQLAKICKTLCGELSQFVERPSKRPPIYVPADADQETLEAKHAEMRQEPERVRDIAEAWFSLPKEERQAHRALCQLSPVAGLRIAQHQLARIGA